MRLIPFTSFRLGTYTAKTGNEKKVKAMQSRMDAVGYRDQ